MKALAVFRRMDWSRLETVWLVVFLLAVVTVGCAGTQEPATPSQPVSVSDKRPSTEQMLRNGIRSWLGTPHRIGGMSRRGIDCSGLTVNLYRDLFGIRLPRTTRAQMRSGRWVERGQLIPGDLVFFKAIKKYHHVGIYLGRGEFVHTSTRQGVMISRLDDNYWRSCYLTGRRLLP